jgi:flagellar hook assembly protein FlgD
LPRAAEVQLVIYNILGQVVRNLVNTRLEAGYYQAVWDGRNDTGLAVGSGIYIYKFRAGEYQNVRKMILMK